MNTNTSEVMLHSVAAVAAALSANADKQEHALLASVIALSFEPISSTTQDAMAVIEAAAVVDVEGHTSILSSM